MSSVGFPNLQGPFVDLGSGQITQPWFQLLVNLWQAVFGNNALGAITGEVKAYAGDSVPPGYLECDGSAISRTTYANLFGAINTLWGIGDGSTTFNIPDLRDRFMIGADAVSIGVGTLGGAATRTLLTTNLPAHSHGVSDPGHTHTFTGVAHGHTLTDPGHIHTFTGTAHNHPISDPGHIHAISDPTHTHPSVEGSPLEAQAGSGGGFAATLQITGAASTGVTINSNTTGITTQNTTAAGTISNNTTGATVATTTAAGTNSVITTGITTTNTGSGVAFSILPPYAGVIFIIKT